jgi:hypothetical protein
MEPHSRGSHLALFDAHTDGCVALFPRNEHLVAAERAAQSFGRRTQLSIYRADINDHQLWSRISTGESLTMEITVAPKERQSVVPQIASVQAGYRGFGHSVPDHPHYAQLLQQGRASSTSSCIVNYECDVTL